MGEEEKRETDRMWAQIAPHCHHWIQKALGETDDTVGDAKQTDGRS